MPDGPTATVEGGAPQQSGGEQKRHTEASQVDKDKQKLRTRIAEQARNLGAKLREKFSGNAKDAKIELGYLAQDKFDASAARPDLSTIITKGLPQTGAENSVTGSPIAENSPEEASVSDEPGNSDATVKNFVDELNRTDSIPGAAVTSETKITDEQVTPADAQPSNVHEWIQAGLDRKDAEKKILADRNNGIITDNRYLDLMASINNGIIPEGYKPTSDTATGTSTPHGEQPKDEAQAEAVTLTTEDFEKQTVGTAAQKESDIPTNERNSTAVTAEATTDAQEPTLKEKAFEAIKQKLTSYGLDLAQDKAGVLLEMVGANPDAIAGVQAVIGQVGGAIKLAQESGTKLTKGELAKFVFTKIVEDFQNKKDDSTADEANAEQTRLRSKILTILMAIGAAIGIAALEVGKGSLQEAGEYAKKSTTS